MFDCAVVKCYICWPLTVTVKQDHLSIFLSPLRIERLASMKLLRQKGQRQPCCRLLVWNEVAERTVTAIMRKSLNKLVDSYTLNDHQMETRSKGQSCWQKTSSEGIRGGGQNNGHEAHSNTEKVANLSPQSPALLSPADKPVKPPSCLA